VRGRRKEGEQRPHITTVPLAHATASQDSYLQLALGHSLFIDGNEHFLVVVLAEKDREAGFPSSSTAIVAGFTWQRNSEMIGTVMFPTVRRGTSVSYRYYHCGQPPRLGGSSEDAQAAGHVVLETGTRGGRERGFSRDGQGNRPLAARGDG
jgi:hypothetical protein